MTKTLRTAALAAILVGGISSMALAECPAQPKVPAMPADGTKATGKEMEATIKDMETYSDSFAKFNECAIKEYNATMETWNKTVADYQSKNKKK